MSHFWSLVNGQELGAISQEKNITKFVSVLWVYSVTS